MSAAGARKTTSRAASGIFSGPAGRLNPPGLYPFGAGHTQRTGFGDEYMERIKSEMNTDIWKRQE